MPASPFVHKPIEHYSDGIMLEKDSGKSPILTCGRSDAELCSLLLDRLLHDLGIR